MKSKILGLLTVTLLAGPMAAQAVTYNVDRSWTDGGGGNASLVGALDVALGTYTIMNRGASPFTNINLSLTVNGTSFTLDRADTQVIFGTGQFFIDATPTFLTFVANGDGGNPADLFFRDATNAIIYAIGSDGFPQFEIAMTPTGTVLASVQFPVIFGTAADPEPVPEPGTLALLGLGLAGLGLSRRRKA